MLMFCRHLLKKRVRFGIPPEKKYASDSRSASFGFKLSRESYNHSETTRFSYSYDISEKFRGLNL